MNNTQKIEQIFSDKLQNGESKPLLFVPIAKHKKVIGIMMTSNINVALSLHNGTDLIFNQQSVFHGSQVSPDDRVIKLDEPLNGNAIKGIVSGLQNNTGASVYLIIETQE
jgi:hypothetical protein